jgi:hypothetical protein
MKKLPSFAPVSYISNSMARIVEPIGRHNMGVDGWRYEGIRCAYLRLISVAEANSDQNHG